MALRGSMAPRDREGLRRPGRFAEGWGGPTIPGMRPIARSGTALLLITLAWGCAGSEDPPNNVPTTPAPTATPAAGDLNMTLRAHLDFAMLTGSGAASASHPEHPDDGSETAPAATSGSGNWGYTAPDGRRFALTGTSL